MLHSSNIKEAAARKRVLPIETTPGGRLKTVSGGSFITKFICSSRLCAEMFLVRFNVDGGEDFAFQIL